jgi:hypothetical protein
MTLCVGHLYYSKQTVAVDALRERRPPFSPEAVVEEFAILLRSYHIAEVVGDKYGGEWPREQFSNFGVLYQAAAAPKSDLYRDLLPLINSRRVRTARSWQADRSVDCPRTPYGPRRSR